MGLIALFFTIAPIIPARAADPTPSDTPTPPEAVETIPPDAVTTDKGTITRVDFPPQPYSFINNQTPSLSFQVSAGNALSVPDLTDINTRLNTQSYMSLPAEFQQYLIDQKNKKFSSGKVTYCTDTNGHITQQTSKRYVSSDNNGQLDQINNISTAMAVAYLPNYGRTPDENGSILYKEPAVVMSPDAPLPCDNSGESGQTIDTTTPTPYVEGGFLATLIKWFEKLFANQTGGQTTKSVLVNNLFDLKRANPILIGTNGGPTNALPKDEQDQLSSVQEGGVLGSFFPGEMSGPSGGNGAVNNFSVDDPAPVPVNFTNVKTLVDDETMLRCIGSPEEYDGSDSRPANCDATFEGTSSDCSSVTGNANITAKFTIQSDVEQAIQQATQGKMPACIIEGVKYHESDYYWNPTSSCQINACSATGPFQIEVGVDSNMDATCPQCPAAKGRCGGEWINHWPQAPDQNATNPCDLTAASQRIVYLMQNKAREFSQLDLGTYQEITNAPANQQRDVIIDAGNRYYGSSLPDSNFGNCSYGEFIYKHCDPTYCCGSNNVILKNP